MSRSRARRAHASGALAALATVVTLAAGATSGCGGTKRPPVGTYSGSYEEGTGKRDRTTQPAEPKGSLPAPLKSHTLADAPDEALGPYLARRDGAIIAAWITAAESGARKLVTATLDESGALRGPPRVVAQTPVETSSLVVRAAGSGKQGGFVVAWTSLADKGEALRLLALADDGRPRGQPIEVARTVDDITGLDVVPTPRGAVALWAEQTSVQQAIVDAVALDLDGRPRGVPSHVAKGAMAWRAMPTTMGIGLALVTSPGQLSWSKLDADARPVGAPVVVAPKGVGRDVEAAKVGDAWVFAWTDRTGLDPQVSAAAVADATGAVRPPEAALSALGGASLVALVGGASDGLVAWDESSRQGHAGHVHFTRITAEGRPSPGVASPVLDLEGAAPEVVRDGTGFAVLGAARTCALRDDAAACARASSIPTFVRFDDALAVTQVEALRVGEAAPAASARGLDCAVSGPSGSSASSGSRCLALATVRDGREGAGGESARGAAPAGPASSAAAASTAAPGGSGATDRPPGGAPRGAPVLAVDLAPRKSAYRAPTVPSPPADAPRATALGTLAAGQPFVEVAASKRADGAAYVATITAAVEEPGARGPKPGAKEATVAISVLDASGAPQTSAPVLITTRALSAGGVAVAAAPRPEDGAVVAWVAREGGDPQVHLATVDRAGKKGRDVIVTPDKGDATDVTVSWTGHGWLLAWVDARDGNGEVYATVASPDLHFGARERLTHAPGDASDLTMLVVDDGAWLAWADPRESPHDGFADVYLAKVGLGDAKRVGDEVRVLATAAHSRSPSLAPNPEASGGVVVAWIEEAPLGADPAQAASYGAMFAWLDRKGKLARSPVRSRGAGDGFPTAVALDAAATGKGAPLAVVARASRDELALDAIDFAGAGGAARTFALLGLSGPPSLDVSLALAGGVLYYNDGGPTQEDDRARRMTLSWK